MKSPVIAAAVFIALVLITLVLGARPRAAHWDDVCVEWRTDLVPIANPVGQNMGGIPMGTTISLVPTQVCVREERQCVIDPRLPGTCNQ